jgi:hypothetical protein
MICMESVIRCDVNLGGKHYIVRSKHMFYVDRDSWMGYPNDETAKVWFDYTDGCYYGSKCRPCHV